MATAPTNITSLPVPPNSADTSTFDIRADAFLLALPTMVTQVNSANSTTYSNAVEAVSSASTATTKAAEASTSASNASSSASSASSSASSALTSWNNLDKRFLGSKTSDPTLDNQGGALVAGACYFNTSTNKIRAYNGSAWVDGVTSSGFNPAVPGAIGATTPDTGNFTTLVSYNFSVTGATIPANGLFLPAANTLGISSNTLERLRVDSTGNIYVGTSNANAGGSRVLECNNNSSTAGTSSLYKLSTGSSNSYTLIDLRETGHTFNISTGAGVTGGFYLTSGAGGFVFRNGATNAYTISSTGVGTYAKAQIVTPAALTVSANAVAVDLSASNNFTLTLQATTGQTLSNPTNAEAGQSGHIAITQNATPSTLAFGSNWLSTDGTTPTVSTTANAVNLLSYYVVSSTQIWFTLNKRGIA